MAETLQQNTSWRHTHTAQIFGRLQNIRMVRHRPLTVTVLSHYVDSEDRLNITFYCILCRFYSILLSITLQKLLLQYVPYQCVLCIMPHYILNKKLSMNCKGYPRTTLAMPMDEEGFVTSCSRLSGFMKNSEISE